MVAGGNLLISSAFDVGSDRDSMNAVKIDQLCFPKLALSFLGANIQSRFIKYPGSVLYLYMFFSKIQNEHNSFDLCTSQLLVLFKSLNLLVETACSTWLSFLLFYKHFETRVSYNLDLSTIVVYAEWDLASVIAIKYSRKQWSFCAVSHSSPVKVFLFSSASLSKMIRRTPGVV